ncbi:MAG: SH3 domain-containing protein, partial [Rectinemataceae bacterium]|nr:SH3 domain-containing protein [Rectinemataceae bacterium]
MAVPTASDTYTIEPSTTTDCGTLCTAVTGVATFASFPTCAAATCSSGYALSGTSCVALGGGAVLPSDTTPPTNTSIIIAGGAAETASRSVVLHFTADGAANMAISNTSDFAGASWEAYIAKKEWTLTSGNGIKTVYAKFKDAAGNVSSPVSDTITLNETSIPTAETPTPTTQPERTLLRYDSSPKVYVVKNGNQVWIRTLEEFNAAGYKWANVKVISTSVVKTVGSVTLLRAEGDNRVYVIHNNTKRHVQSAAAFNAAGYKWEDIKVVGASEVNKYNNATAHDEGTLIKSSDSAKVYVIKGGKRAWISTAAAFNGAGYKWTDIIVIGSADLAAYEETEFAAQGTGNIIITSKWLRVRSSDSTATKTLAFVKEGETYGILAESGNWFKIKTAKGIEGWVSKDYA